MRWRRGTDESATDTVDDEHVADPVSDDEPAPSPDTPAPDIFAVDAQDAGPVDDGDLEDASPVDVSPDDAGVAPAVDAPVAARPHPRVPIDLGEVDADALAQARRRAAVRALAEDLDTVGDVTSVATVPASLDGTADLVARSAGVVAGLDVAREVFAQVDGRLTFTVTVEDGAAVEAGQVIGTVAGPLRSILTAERTALNFLGHLSGIATQTRRYAELLDGTETKVRDTRKTTPGLRLLEKAAVKAGGGANHRIGLHDALMVKDNHVLAAGGAGAAARAAMVNSGGRHVQVEVTSIDEIEEVLAAGVVDILLDNFTPAEVREAVTKVDGRAGLEASGNITLDTIRAYADAGVDRIASGALTHSAPWLDIALDVRPADTGDEADAADHATASEDDGPDAGASDWALSEILDVPLSDDDPTDELASLSFLDED